MYFCNYGGAKTTDYEVECAKKIFEAFVERININERWEYMDL